MNKEKFIQYITKIGFNNFDPKSFIYKGGILTKTYKGKSESIIQNIDSISTIENITQDRFVPRNYFKYSNDDIDCYIIFLVDNNINIFANDRNGNRLLGINGNEDKILEELKNFLKKDIRDILLNVIINS